MDQERRIRRTGHPATLGLDELTYDAEVYPPLEEAKVLWNPVSNISPDEGPRSASFLRFRSRSQGPHHRNLIRLRGALQNRSDPELKELEEELRTGTFDQDQAKRRKNYGGKDGYVEGIELAKLAALNRLFPKKRLRLLCVCLCEAPDLDPKNLFRLCQIFPWQRAADLSRLTRAFRDEILATAIAQKTRFPNGINPQEVAEVLQCFPELSIKVLSSRSREYPAMTFTEVVLMARLQLLFPDAGSQMIAGALADWQDGDSLDDIAFLARNGLFSSNNSALDPSSAMSLYRHYRDWLTSVALDPPSFLVSWALRDFSEIKDASFEEIEMLIEEGIVSDKDVGANPRNLVGRYRKYKETLPLLRSLFPESASSVIDDALRAVNDIENSSLDEFVALIDAGIVARSEGHEDPGVAVDNYRQYKGNLDVFQDLYPRATPTAICLALNDLVRIPDANFDEFLWLIESGLLYRGELSSFPGIVVNQYREYKSNIQHLAELFPDATQNEVENGLRDLSVMPFPKLAEFVALVRSGRLSREVGPDALSIAVSRYREYMSLHFLDD